jgi:hypothetical protein
VQDVRMGYEGADDGLTLFGPRLLPPADPNKEKK